jgi:Uma2 family endonuclease
VTAVLDLRGQQANTDDDRFYEIVRGERVEKRPMGMLQAWVASTLLAILDNFVRSHRLGKVISESLFVLDPATDLQRRPDLAFVSRQRVRKPVQSAAWGVVPDLAVEVISPTNRAPEVLEKIDEYFAAGVRLVWVVYCQPRQVYVYGSPVTIQVLTPQDTLDGDAVIPGFTLPVAKLFEDLDEAEETSSAFNGQP